MSKRKERLKKYINYIKNAGEISIIDNSYCMFTHYFDEDWSPIGKEIRKEMEREGIIENICDGDIIKLIKKAC